MDWKFTPNDNLAYILKDSEIIITDQVCSTRTGPEVMTTPDDDFYCTKFNIHEDGSVSVEDWIDLRQFNNSSNIMAQIQLLNEVVSQKTGLKKEDESIVNIMKEQPIFKVMSSQLNNGDSESLYDLEAVIQLDGLNYHLQKQFIKYTFIDSEICDKRWTIKELLNFTVHMQKFLYEQETLAKLQNFLQIDSDIEALLKG